jgi:tRNA modification GTPase
MSKNNFDDTIVAISTPVGEGGISIVRLSGPEALKISGKIFVNHNNEKVSSFKTYTVHYGHIIKKGDGPEIIDEVILTVMKAPKSYTKEDIVEINCHGGIQAVKKVLELIIAGGARMAEPGEFTKRAFLNGRIDLAQAEAVLDVIRSKTEGSLKVAMQQLEGGLSDKINSLRDAALDLASEIEASIDFPEEDIEIPAKETFVKKIEGITHSIKQLLDTFDEGIVLREGVLAIICGKPNVGKSSLMNLLLKRDRVIVSPIPGTTRDAVEEMINLKGIPIRLVDTAGIGSSKNMLDKEGIKRAKRYIEMADIAIFVLDGSTKIEKPDLDIKRLIGKKRKIIVMNKSDLRQKVNLDEIRGLFSKYKVIDISVRKRRNISLLEKEIAGMILSGNFTQGESAVVSNARHKALLDKAYVSMLKVLKEFNSGRGAELIAIDLKEAIFNLGLVIGKSVSDDILDRIFDQFCIGK